MFNWKSLPQLHLLHTIWYVRSIAHGFKFVHIVNVFIDSSFQLYPTNGSSFRQLDVPADAASAIVAEARRKGDLIGVRMSIADIEDAQDRRRMPVWSKKSRGLPVVVLQETAQSLIAAHFAIAGTHPLFSCCKEQTISSPLMVSLAMVMLGERRYRSPQ